MMCSIANAMTAKSYIVTDMEGIVLIEKNADEIRPIASITKLVTARASIAFDPAEEIRILAEDFKAGRMRSTPLRIGESYTRELLTKLALISSDNVASLALARTSTFEFLLPETMQIVEGSGLDRRNVSSARGIAELARSMADSELARISIEPSVTIRNVTKKSTNPLLTRNGWTFRLSKTGFTNPAGGCLVAVFESGGRYIVAVILGSRDVPARWRDLIELRKLIDSGSFEGVIVRKPRTKRYKS